MPREGKLMALTVETCICIIINNFNHIPVSHVTKGSTSLSQQRIGPRGGESYMPLYLKMGTKADC